MTEARLKTLADDWDKISKGRADTTWESGYRRARAVCALELRAALATPAPAQPEPMGEPVALIDRRSGGFQAHWVDPAEADKLPHGTPLYAHPPAASTPAVPEPSPGAEGDEADKFKSIGWTGVWRSNLRPVERYVLSRSKIVPTQHDAEAMVAQWAKQFEAKSFSYETEEVFVRVMEAGAAAPVEGAATADEIRQRALEEAAQIADGRVQASYPGDDWRDGYSEAAREIAGRLRRLAAPTSPTPAQEGKP